MEISSNMSSIKVRSTDGNVQRSSHRPSVGSHLESEESKTVVKEEGKRLNPQGDDKKDAKSRQAQAGAHKKRAEQVRSKSEMIIAPPDAQGKLSSFVALRKCLERDAFWDKLVNKRLGKFFQPSLFKSLRQSRQGPHLPKMVSPGREQNVIVLYSRP